MITSTTKNKIAKILSVFFWILVWHILSVIIAEEMLLVSPFSVFINLKNLIFDWGAYLAIFNTTKNILLGFYISIIFGIIFACFSYKSSIFENLVFPLMSIIKSTPVVSFIIICLLYIGRERLTSFISFLMALPIIYTNILSGIRNVETKYIELAEIFDVRGIKKFLYVYVSNIFPFFYSACSLSLGLCWKSGIAAEVIGIVRNTIGERVYDSKIYLDTLNLFTWTLIIIFLSFVFEKIILHILNILLKKLTHMKIDVKEDSDLDLDNKDIIIKNVSKSYGNKKVLENISLKIKKDETVCIMGVSGLGKTTFLNILMGLDKDFSGEIIGLSHKKISAVFQEDRLFENLSVMTNLNFPFKKSMDSDFFEKHLKKMGLENILFEEVKTLSGGMKRRVAILRSLIYNSGIVFMDEPFMGLDFSTKQKIIEYIKEMTKGRTLILITHDINEAKEMGGRIINLENFNEI